MPVFNQSRSYIIRLLFVLAFFVMLARLFNLQILSSEYRMLAEQNAVLKKTIYPARGIVYDKNGKTIVKNSLMYDLMVTPSEVRGVDTNYLCQLLGIDTAEFNKRIISAIIKNGRTQPSAFEDLLTPDKYARLEENMWRFGNGFYLQERPVRDYPFNAGAHFMGYIGEVDSGAIARSKGFYRPGDYKGLNGMEAYYENILMGQRGVQYLIKDNLNRLKGRYANGELDEPANTGRALYTYVDIELQQLAEKLMNKKLGAIVAIEPKTGGIITLVSAPNFTPTELTGPNFKKTYSKFVLDVSRPLLNRAIKGQYPPGSTFKPFGGLVALDEGIITPSFGYPCGGRYYACGHGKPACEHKNPGHAANLSLAIANSCNSYFAHIYRMTVDNSQYRNVKDGYEKWKDYMNAFGLGKRLGVDLPSEDRGNIPDSSDYNKEYRNAWNSCTNLTLGIGQDKMTATPIQLANAMCIIANKGYYYTPHFVKSIEKETEKDSILKPFRIKHEPLTRISDTAYQAVMIGMQRVVESGTAFAAKIPGINMCAKTGTAQNFRFIRGKKIELNENSMFVAFAPRENPKIAICVVVENAGFGSTAAAPIASLLIEKYLNDSLRAESKKKVEELSNKDLLPSILATEQYIFDSTRAEQWAKRYGDSTQLKKYLRKHSGASQKRDTIPPRTVFVQHVDMIDPGKQNLKKRSRV
jgi:penicillin-binding protein 2